MAALAETMNTMVVRLREQIQDGRRAAQRAGGRAAEHGGRRAHARQSGRHAEPESGRADKCSKLDPAKVRGRPIHEVMRKADVLTFVEKVLSSTVPDAGRHRGLRQATSTTSRRTATCSATPAKSASACWWCFRDVTQLRHLENVRRDFVANASHELRTPVTSIKGFVETLLDGGLDDRENAERFLRIVLDQANRLAAIINDILSLARVEKDSADQNVILERGPIRDVLDAAVAMCGRQAEAKSIRLAIHCDPDLEADINPGLLEQAVVNLIDNAVKYSPDRQASVEVTAAAENDAVADPRDRSRFRHRGPGTCRGCSSGFTAPIRAAAASSAAPAWAWPSPSTSPWPTAARFRSRARSAKGAPSPSVCRMRAVTTPTTWREHDDSLTSRS